MVLINFDQLMMDKNVKLNFFKSTNFFKKLIF